VSTDINTGGPAFPLFAATGYAGMTLRDYFAAKAMQADISAETWGGDYEATALQSYAVADAMLKAREV
jgi:hypothetical protein